MIQIVREVSADVVKRGSTRSVYAKQHDLNSRFMNVRIQEAGKDLKVDPTVTVILNVERPDKAENMFYGTVNEDGTVKIPLTSWMLELEGTLLCDISLVAEDETVAKLTTMQFNIYVEAAVRTDESIVETEDYSVIVDLLKRTTDAEASAVNAADRAAAAAQDAEILKANCEAATDSANKAAADANAVREGVQAGGYIESVKELNKGAKFSWWLGTTAEYNALELNGEILDNCFYIITDDSFAKTTKEALDELYLSFEELKAAYNIAAQDTGWLNWTRDGTVIGQYRLVGKMVYFNLQYEPTDFMDYTAFSNGEPDEIALPVVLDCPKVEGIYTFPYIFPLTHVYVKDGVEDCKQVMAEMDYEYSKMKVWYLNTSGSSAGVFGSFVAIRDTNAAVG